MGGGICNNFQTISVGRERWLNNAWKVQVGRSYEGGEPRLDRVVHPSLELRMQEMNEQLVRSYEFSSGMTVMSDTDNDDDDGSFNSVGVLTVIL